MADSGLAAADVPQLQKEVGEVVEQHWPGMSALLVERDLLLDELVWGRHIYPLDHAKNVLGYQPQYGFDAFLQALGQRDTSHYPYADEPWWGVQRPAGA